MVFYGTGYKRLMLKIFTFLISIFIYNSIYAAAVYDGKPLPEDETERCKIAVVEMIKLFESNIPHIKREERKEQHQSLIKEWKARQNSDEDPCKLYQAIFNHAFTL